MAKSDYVDLYKKYDLYRSDIYMLAETRIDDIYMLFDEVVELLYEDRAFNNMLPPEFRNSAKSFLDGDLVTIYHFAQISNRAFMLSDLIDFLALIKSKKTN